METLLGYLLKSTICISILYLVFRWTLKKESLFALNRFLLLAILVSSVAIPLIKMPVLFHQTIDVKVFPEKNLIAMPNMDDVAMEITTTPTTQYTTVSTERTVSVEQITTIIYAIGVLTLSLALLIALAKIGFLLFKTKVYKKKNYNLALVNGTVSPMSFGKFIIMSKQDYKDHRKEILKHELTHIKFKHTYDLLLVELIKLFHWFNPLVYQLRNDLKEIQEFQIDQHLLRSGINSKEYQLLLIKKCVGTERYALANSFNHCQIKNRIVMMNNSKNRKGKSWKVAIFLPVAVLMLMALGNKRSEIPIDESQEEQTTVYNSENKNSNYKLPTESEWKIAAERLKAETTSKKKIWTESDFEKLTQAEASKLREKDFFEGKTWHSVFINRNSEILMDNKRAELNEVGQRMKLSLDNTLATAGSDIKNETKSITPKVFVLKDIGTDANNYSNLLTILANTFIDAREELSKSKFNMSYDKLNIENRKVIDTMIPINIKIGVPKQISTEISSVPSPIFIEINTTGIYLNNELATLEEMKNKISKQVAKEPEIVISVGVGIGISDKQVNDVKSALREAGALYVNYSSDFKEKDYPKQMGIQPPPITIEIKETGIYCMNDLVSIDRLKEIITKNIASHPNQIISLKVDPEAKMGDFTAVKEVLREAKALHVNYSTNTK